MSWKNKTVRTNYTPLNFCILFSNMRTSKNRTKPPRSVWGQILWPAFWLDRLRNGHQHAIHYWKGLTPLKGVSRFRQKIRSKFNAVPRTVFAEVMGSCDDGCPSRSIWNKSRNMGAFWYTPIADCGLPQRGDSLTSGKAAALVEYNCQQQTLI